MDSIKGERVVRLDKYFINFFDIATNEVTRGPVPRHKQTTENIIFHPNFRKKGSSFVAKVNEEDI